MKVNALVPMKGHSERVSGKNIKNFCDLPLFYYVIDTLLKSGFVGKVVVKTDSQEIKESVLKFFNTVIIIDRPQDICGDMVSMNDIITYDLKQVEGEHFIQTHATNPLLKTQTINAAVQEYFDNLSQFDSLFSVTKIKTRLYREDFSPINHNPSELIRTQDLPPIFSENSNFYIFSKHSFNKAGNKRIGLKPRMFEINELEAIDIDTSEEFELAEILYKKRKGVL